MTKDTSPPSVDEDRPSVDATPASEDLAERSVSAARSGVALSLARVILQFVSQILMARMLGPEPFGVFGLALVAFTFMTFIAEFGFGMVIMQRPKLLNRDVRYVFTWQMTLGAIATVALLAIAPWLADWYENPGVGEALWWMAIGSLLNAAAATGVALLMRELRFRAIGMIDLIGYAIGYLGVGLALAAGGHGMHALVIAWLVHASIRTLLVLYLRPHAMQPLWRSPLRSRVLDTGLRVLLTNVVNWFLQNVDRIIIGRLLSAHAVGLYNAGNNLATTGGTLLVNALQPAFVSGGARLQKNPQLLGRVWVQILATTWIIAAPAFVIAAAIAPAVIQLLYGDRWAGAAGVLAALLLGMPFYLTAAMSTPVLWNCRQGHREPLLQIPVLIVGGVALALLTPAGVHVAAWVVTGLYVARAVVLAVAAARATQTPAAQVLAPLARGFVICLVAGTLALVTAWLVKAALPGIAFVEVLVGGAVPVGVLAVAALLRPTLLGDDALSMLGRISPPIGRLLARRSSTTQDATDTTINTMAAGRAAQ